MEELTIEVQKREETGDGACRRLRRAGWVPGVVYGGGRDPLPIQIERKPLLEILAKGGGENRVFLLRLAGTDKSRHTMIRDLQVDPVSRQVIHVDFQRVLLDAKVRVKVRVEIAGTAWGVKNEAGMLEFVSREVEVECLPSGSEGRCRGAAGRPGHATPVRQTSRCCRRWPKAACGN